MVDEKKVLEYLVSQVKRRMRERELKVWYMAYYSDMGNCSFGKFLKGRLMPNPWHIILMAEILDCTVNDLLGYEYYYKPENPQASGICMAQKRILERLSDEILHRMNEKNINTGDLAWISGESEYVINSWSLGNYTNFGKKSTYTLLNICDVLDCTPSDLLGY